MQAMHEVGNVFCLKDVAAEKYPGGSRNSTMSRVTAGRMARVGSSAAAAQDQDRNGGASTTWRMVAGSPVNSVLIMSAPSSESDAGVQQQPLEVLGIAQWVLPRARDSTINGTPRFSHSLATMPTRRISFLSKSGSPLPITRNVITASAPARSASSGWASRQLRNSGRERDFCWRCRGRWSNQAGRSGRAGGFWVHPGRLVVPNGNCRG